VDNIKNEFRVVEWVDLAQDMDQWKALVSAVINLGVS
jgi:hypothetical protein